MDTNPAQQLLNRTTCTLLPTAGSTALAQSGHITPANKDDRSKNYAGQLLQQQRTCHFSPVAFRSVWNHLSRGKKSGPEEQSYRDWMNAHMLSKLRMEVCCNETGCTWNQPVTILEASRWHHHTRHNCQWLCWHSRSAPGHTDQQPHKQAGRVKRPVPASHRMSQNYHKKLRPLTQLWQPWSQNWLLDTPRQWVPRKHWAAAQSTQSSTIESNIVHVVDYCPRQPLTVVRGWPAGLHWWCCHAKSECKMRVTSRPFTDFPH